MEWRLFFDSNRVIAFHLHITGVVQGVFFRKTMKQEADALGVHGWVRNLPDGAVEAHVEGSEDAVRSLLEWARRGPPHAHVTAVREQSAEAGGHKVFDVLR